MKRLLFTALIIATFGQCFAQSDSIRIRDIEAKLEAIDQNLSTAKSDLFKLKEVNKRLFRNVTDLKLSGQTTDSRLDSLQILLQLNRQSIGELSELISSQKTELTGQIHKTEQSASERIESLDESLSKNTLYWIIAVLALGLITLGLFLMLRKRVSDNQSSIVENISSTRKQLEQEGIRLDEKLIGIMETQLKVIQEDKTSSSNTSEPDHSLALKVADEIVRIEKNLERIEDQKRIKPLAKALERIRANFQSNGYEIISLLNQKFDDRMSLDVINFKVDENLNAGERIISRVVKPQVNYNGVLIQRGQVDVSQSE